MKSSIISLNLVTSPEFFSLARDMTEKTSLAMGLGQNEAAKVGMATEEIFVYLCNISPGKPLSIHCVFGGYCVKIQFVFFAELFPLESFNLTSRVDFSNKTSLENMGLLIASRMVDRFSVETGVDDRLCLTLVKEKKYEPAQTGEFNWVPASTSFRVRPAEPEEAGYLARAVCSLYPLETIPRPFAFPGMVVDMLRHGQNHTLVAVGPGGEILGGIAWEWSPGAKIAESHGPYVLTENRDSAVCEELLNQCISQLSRLPVVGLINRCPNQDLPTHYFERIGELPLEGQDGTALQIPHYFRQMHEDLGSAVWVHERLEPFLSEKYKALALPRKILRADLLSRASSGRSVMFTKFEPPRRAATIWPVCQGGDIGANLAAHLKMLRGEDTGGIFFSLDLGRPWQAEFIPPAMDFGFSPRLIMPYGGMGDIVLFSL